jgi:uncharacterized coiled-coil protein SlyX
MWQPVKTEPNFGSEELEMLKKMVLVGLVGLGSATAVVTTGAWSYIRTGVSTASDTMRDSVPIEWEIKRARQMIADLKPEIAQNMQVVAREEVGVKNLAEQISAKETQLAKSRDDIMRLKGDLESGSVRFVYAGRSYTGQEVKDDLSERFKQFQVQEETANKLAKVLSAREKNLDAARRKLDGMLSAKRDLEVQVENLQARLTMVQVVQTTNPVSLDDSQLSSTRKLLDEIRTRIDVQETLANSEGSFGGGIVLDDPTSPDLLNEIADYFGEGRADVENLVSAQGL